MEKSSLTAIEKFVIEIAKKKRLERGITQKELAFGLEKSLSFIGDIENPNRRAKFNLNHINELAKFFECSPRDFLPGKPL